MLMVCTFVDLNIKMRSYSSHGCDIMSQSCPMTFDAKQVWEKLKSESMPSRRQSKKDTQYLTTKPSTKRDKTSPLTKTEYINNAELTRLLQAKDSNTRRQALHKLKVRPPKTCNRYLMRRGSNRTTPTCLNLRPLS